MKTKRIQSLEPSKAEPNLTNRVFEYVIEHIRQGRFRSGMRLVQRDLARQLKISQAPVREALEKLTQSGWTEHLSGRSGVYVKDYSNTEELRQLFEVRRALEIEAIRLLAQRITDEELAQWQRLLDTLHQTDREEQRRLYQQADIEFHLFIVRHCGNALLIRIFEPIMQQNYCYKMQSEMMDLLFHVLRPIESIPQRAHQPIFDAVKNRDPDQAEKEIRRHIQKLTPEDLAEALKPMQTVFRTAT